MRINESSRYNYIPVRQMEQPATGQKQAGQNELSSGAAADTASTLQQDMFVLSAESKRRIEEKSLQNQHQAAKQDIESANAQIEAISESAEVLRKCLIIAARIISGDEVPVEDHLYLVEHDPELYGKAISMRIVREDPKRYKRISDDESTESHRDTSVNPFENRESKLPDIGEMVDLSIVDNASGQTTPAVQPDRTESPD